MRPRRPQGAMLGVALAVMAVLLVLVTMALSATAREARLHASRVARAQAFYLAEAGRQRAISTLANTNNWNKDNTWYPFGAGEYRVVASATPGRGKSDLWTLTCYGRVPGPGGTVTESVTQQLLLTWKSAQKIQKLTLEPDTWRRQ